MFRFNNMAILKVTKDCNLRCSYCYVHNKDSFKGKMMDFELYKKIIQKIIDDKIKQESENQTMSLIFHGGEPLMSSKNLLMRMLEYASENFKKNNISYNFGMQSNLTLLDEEYIMILKRFNVSLGVSFDGVKENNSNRTYLEQNFYENKFKLMDKYQLDYGFLIVAGEKNVKDVWKSAEFLRKKYKKLNLKVNFVEDVNGIGGETDGKTFFNYAWKPFFEDFFKNDKMREGNCDIMINKFLHYFLNNKPAQLITNCGDTVCGAGINIVEIEPEGNISFCGRYSEDFEISHVQYALDRDFLALHQIKRYIDFINFKQKTLLDTGCDGCYAKNICDHGCMAFYYSKFKKWGIRTDLVCDIYKEAYKYMTIYIVDILKAKTQLLNKKQKQFSMNLEIDAERCINNNSMVFNNLRKKYGIRVYEDPENKKIIIFEL